MLLLGQNSKVCLEWKATLHEKIIEGYKVIMLNKIIELICRLIEIKIKFKYSIIRHTVIIFMNTKFQFLSIFKFNFNSLEEKTHTPYLICLP